MYSLFRIINLFCKFASIDVSLREAHNTLISSMETNIYNITSNDFQYAIRSAYLSMKRNGYNHYVAISSEDPTKITYFNQSPKDLNLDELEKNFKTRVTTTLGKYLAKKCGILKEDGVKESDLVKFVDMVNASIKERYDLLNRDVVSLDGDGITDFYANHATHSCMTEENAPKIKMLSVNPDKVKLITLDKARALLWHCDDGTIVLDRAYPAASKYILPLRHWATQKGYVLRKNPDSLEAYGTTVQLTDGNEHRITLSYDGVTQFPFLDTFRFGKFIEDEHKVVLSNNSGWGTTEFSNTEGTFRGMRTTSVTVESPHTCQDCNESINVEDDCYMTYRDNPLCESCYSEDYFTCSDCGDIFHNDNLNTIDGDYDHLYCENCLSSYAFNCHNCGDTKPNDDAFYGSDEVPYCQECFDEKFIRCEDCEEATPIDDSTSIDDKTLCKDCLESEYEKCVSCNEYKTNEDILEVDGEFICAECNDDYLKCPVCDSWQFKDGSKLLQNDKTSPYPICAKCVKDYGECNECGNPVTYPMIKDTCATCFPELYTKQYKLPFSKEDKEKNIRVKDSRNKNLWIKY